MTSLEKIPPHLHKALRKSLGAGERIVWVAQPIPVLMARKAKKFLLFALCWTGFTAYLAVISVISADTASPLLFGFMVVFTLLGALLFLMPFQLMSEARNSVYAVTDLRAIIVQKSRRMKVRSFYPAQFKEINTVEHADGSGDLLFAGVEESGDSRARYIGLTGFEAVPDVKRAELALLSLMQSLPITDSAPRAEPPREF